MATRALIKVISFICCQHYNTLLPPIMQLKWPTTFSVLNGPSRFYHTASFSLNRNNWKHGFHFHKHLPGLWPHRLATIHNAISPKSKCTAPLSTSAYIVYMGLNKIWRNVRPHAPKLSKESCEVSQSESCVSSSLQPQQPTNSSNTIL